MASVVSPFAKKTYWQKGFPPRYTLCFCGGWAPGPEKNRTEPRFQPAFCARFEPCGSELSSPFLAVYSGVPRIARTWDVLPPSVLLENLEPYACRTS
jgi:hypothetical protein